jgi:putative transposase
LKFGSKIAANLHRQKPRASHRGRLDELVSTTAGERAWVWRAVDDEGDVMNTVVQRGRDAGAAIRLLRRLLKHQHVEPQAIVTGGQRSFRAAVVGRGRTDRHRV